MSDLSIFCIGGVWTDQTTDIQKALKARGYNVQSPDGVDDWKKDIVKLVREHNTLYKMAVLHSFGSWAFINAAEVLGGLGIDFNYAVFFDPVHRGWKRHMEVPSNVMRWDWFVRSQWFGPPTANLDDSREPVIVKGNHSSILHKSIQFVVDQAAKVRWGSV